MRATQPTAGTRSVAQVGASGRRWQLRRPGYYVAALFAGLALGFGALPSGLSLRGALPVRAVATHVALASELQRVSGAVAHTWITTHPPQGVNWSWGEGVLVFGLAFQQSRNPETRDYLRAYLRHHTTRGVTVHSSDDATPGLLAAEFALAGETEFTPLIARVANYGLSAPRTPLTQLWLHLGRAPWPIVRQLLPAAWIDSVFHLVPALLRYSALTHDLRYRDRAAEQLLGFCRALQDPRTGLFTHAYDDPPHERRVPSFEARLFWARGNGWMLATLVDALELLPRDYPIRPQLMAAAERARVAVEAVQAPSGLFHTLLVRPDSYQETAGSALILYALARGVRLGLFPDSTRAVAVRGARGLLSVVRLRGASAEVTGTSLGTNPVAGAYAITPTADQISYGVGAWLMAAHELARLP